MSETVGRKGKLTLCKKYKDADELQANLQDFWQSIPREERNIYYRDVKEIDTYGLEDNGYIVINGNCIYKVELENAIYTQENKDGEIMFFELLGQSKLNGIKLTIDGREPYRRLLIRRVYPAIKNQPTDNERKSNA